MLVYVVFAGVATPPSRCSSALTLLSSCERPHTKNTLLPPSAASFPVDLLCVVRPPLSPAPRRMPHQLVKTFRRGSPAVYRLVKLGGVLYLLTMCACTIAGRKHYTIDIALAIIIAGLTFFRFQVLTYVGGLGCA